MLKSLPPTFYPCRYPAQYPSHQVMLRITSAEGLSTDMVRALVHTMNDMAAQHAREAEVRRTGHALVLCNMQGRQRWGGPCMHPGRWWTP